MPSEPSPSKVLGGPGDRRARAQRPVRRARRQHVRGEARRRRRALDAVHHLDGQRRQCHVRVERLDVSVVPRGDLPAEDLRQHARRQVHRRAAHGRRVEDADAAQRERHVHHRAARRNHRVVPIRRHRDVARAEVVERLVAVARAEELLLARAGAHRTVRRVHGEPGTRRHQTEQLPEELRRVGRARAVQHLHAACLTSLQPAQHPLHLRVQTGNRPVIVGLALA